VTAATAASTSNGSRRRQSWTKAVAVVAATARATGPTRLLKLYCGNQISSCAIAIRTTIRAPSQTCCRVNGLPTARPIK